MKVFPAGVTENGGIKSSHPAAIAVIAPQFLIDPIDVALGMRR